VIRSRIGCSDEHLATAFFHLGHLLDAGIAIDDALDDVHSMETVRRMRPVWLTLANEVRAGESLSATMRRWPTVFDASLLAIVGAGETAGQLTKAMHDAESLLRWQGELRNRIAGILTYPLFAVVVLLLVLAFLFTSVVPSLADYLQASKTTLSWHTQSALILSRVLVETSWQGVLIAALPVVIGIFALQIVPHGRRLRDAMILKIPVVGGILKSLWVSRYSHLVGQLYCSGVPLIDAMVHGERAIRNVNLSTLYSDARQSVSQGMTLLNAFDDDPQIPVVFRRMVAVGESTGKLDTALLRCSEQLKRQASYQIERVEKLTGPVMLCLVGSLLLWIVVSVLSPVYQAAIEVVMQ